MIVDRSFYVYVHYRGDSGTPFYFGKGTKQRAYKFHNRTKLWNNIANKHGVTVEIIATELTETQAHLIEKVLIRKHGKIYDGSGILANLTDGGEGVTGLKFTDESKNKLSKSLIAYFSVEENKNALKRAILRNDGKSYACVRDAALDLSCHLGEVSAAASGVRRSCRGFGFRYKDVIGPDTWNLRPMCRNDSQRVAVVRSDGKTYKDISEAARVLGVSHSLIARVLRAGRGTVRGYMFKKISVKGLTA